jgi:hypothetical protein
MARSASVGEAAIDVEARAKEPTKARIERFCLTPNVVLLPILESATG